MKTSRSFFAPLAILLSALFFADSVILAAPASPPESRISLHGTWQLQSSCVDKSSAESISTPGFAAKEWHKAEVPGTVVGALVTDKTLPDPNFGMNLKNFPGACSRR